MLQAEWHTYDGDDYSVKTMVLRLFIVVSQCAATSKTLGHLHLPSSHSLHSYILRYLPPSLFLSNPSSPFPSFLSLLLSLSHATPLKPATGPGKYCELPSESGQSPVAKRFRCILRWKQPSDKWQQRCWRGLQTANFNYKSHGKPKFWGVGHPT